MSSLPAGWLEYGGIEVANYARTLTYLRDVGADPRFTIRTDADCLCPAIDEGPYTSPSVDPAPWYLATIARSASFLGFALDQVEIGGVLARAVTARAGAGGSVGRLRPRPRVVAFSGHMFALDAPGMSYGERWLTDVLRGSIGGCAPDTLRLLPYCPDGSPTEHYRTLTRVGIADGPIFAPEGRIARCIIQRVSFQLVAGNPWLRSEITTCVDSELLVVGS